MTHLVLVSMATPSIQQSFARHGSLPQPSEIFDAWQEIRREASKESARTGTPDRVNATPFSELASLQIADGSAVPAEKITLVLLGNDSDEEPLIQNVAVREDGTRFTHLEYVQAFGEKQYPGAEFEAVWLAMEGYSVVNAGTDTPALRAIIMDHCARVAEQFAGGTETVIVVNAIAGANIAVDALVFAADELGWEAWYRAMESVRFVPRDLNSSALAEQWGQAQALVERFRGHSLTRDEVHASMREAEELGILSFVVPRLQSAEAFRLELNRLGMTLYRRHAAKGRTPYSATWGLLKEQGTEESNKAAKRFRELLNHWARSDLFGSNQVSELVAHTESHCEAVDRNVASVTRPLLAAGTLSVGDVFNLGVAAWLHDWGHSGAGFSTDRDLARIQDPGDIRDVHGILSADRIRSMHSATGLFESERVVPALLAAHHQGWTSAGDAEPTLKAALTGLPPRFWSLTSDISEAQRDGRLEERDARQVPLLVAIFRVCDAADVGVHRAYYVDVIEDRIADEIMLKARRDVEHDEELSRRLGQLRQAITMHFGLKRSPAEFVNPFGDQSGFMPRGVVLADGITKWARHCFEQVEYFTHHRHVLGVHLSMEKEASGWRLTPLVVPFEEGDWAEAAEAVDADIHRELGETVIYGSSGSASSKMDASSPKRVVWELLQGIGISVGYAQRLAEPSV